MRVRVVRPERERVHGAYFARRLVLYTIIKWTVYILHAWHADSVVDDFPTPVILCIISVNSDKQIVRERGVGVGSTACIIWASIACYRYTPIPGTYVINLKC